MRSDGDYEFSAYFGCIVKKGKQKVAMDEKIIAAVLLLLPLILIGLAIVAGG